MNLRKRSEEDVNKRDRDRTERGGDRQIKRIFKKSSTDRYENAGKFRFCDRGSKGTREGKGDEGKTDRMTQVTETRGGGGWYPDRKTAL